MDQLGFDFVKLVKLHFEYCKLSLTNSFVIHRKINKQAEMVRP